MTPIYLDYNATTPLDPAVIEAMLPYLREHFGNPSSTHQYGKTAHEAVEKARIQVAELLGARPDEIVFTGGGTEATNHALKGVIFAKPTDGRPWACDAHIITSTVEHPATLQTCDFLKRLGCKITVLPVDRYGLVDPGDVLKAMDRKTTLVSIMHANNEVGPTPLNRSARFRSMSMSWAWTCCRWPVTNYMRRKESAPCTFVGASSWSH